MEFCGLIEFDRDGAAAEYVTVPAGELAAKPRSVSHADTATLHLAALTAWQALVNYAAVRLGRAGPGDRRRRGSGGLRGPARGHPRRSGQRDGPRPGRRLLLRSLGAQAFIGSGDALPQKAAGFDVIIDTVGGTVLDASYAWTRPGGRLVTLGGPPSQERAKSSGVHAMFFVVTPDPAGLARLAGLADQGRCAPPSARPSRSATAAGPTKAAHRPGPPGKTVLIVR